MIRYFLARSVRGFFDHIAINAVSTGIIFIIFMLFAIYLLIILNLNRTFQYFENNIRITIYMKNDVSRDDMISFKEEISNLNEVKSIHEISSGEALSQFKDLFKMKDFDFSIFENPFPFSLVIEPSNRMSYEEIVLFVKSIKNLKNFQKTVNEIDFGSKWLERTLKALKAFKKAGLFFLAIIFSGLFMIVFNTKRLILSSRKKELEVVKIMGATNTFIKTPFLIEAFFLGIISSSLSLATVYFFWLYLKKEILNVSFLFSEISFFRPLEIGFFVLIGTLMVVVSALFSINKFLREVN